MEEKVGRKEAERGHYERKTEGEIGSREVWKRKVRKMTGSIRDGRERKEEREDRKKLEIERYMGQGKGRGKRAVGRGRVNEIKEETEEESERELKECRSLKLRQKLKVWTSGRSATSLSLWPKPVSAILESTGSISMLTLGFIERNFEFLLNTIVLKKYKPIGLKKLCSG